MVVSAQQKDFPPGYFVETVRNAYDSLDHGDMETGFLLNMGMVFTDYSEDWYAGDPIITSSYSWLALYNAMKDSDTTGLNSFPPDSVFEQYSVINTFGISIIALGVLNMDVDYLTEDTINYLMNNPDSLPDYAQFRVFSGSVMYPETYNGAVIFSYNPDLYFTNTNTYVDGFYVDFEDGMGYQVLDLSAKCQYNVHYSIAGKKSIRFKLIEGTDTLISYSKINIKSLILPTPSKSDPNITLVNGNYYYLEGNDNELDKPVIFIEGFDITGNESAIDLYNTWDDIQVELSERGYDCFFVNLSSPGLSVISNAEQTIQALIQGINEAKTGFNEIVIIGESMGGLISRIALKNLEDQGYDHQCRLYVSYDSPHKGANIPPGVQFAAFRIFNILQSSGLLFNFYISLMSCTLGDFTNFEDVIGRMMSEGAQEMIVNHISGHNQFNNLQDYLSGLGFPQNSRNIAFADGSNAGTPQGITMGSPFIPDITLNSSWPIRFVMECNYSMVNMNYLAFGLTAEHWIPWPWGWETLFTIGDYYTYDDKFYDNAPAGYWDYVNENEIDYRIAFLPIVSAIDLDQELIDLYNLGYFVIDNSHPKELYINNGDVPFDDIYSTVNNLTHVAHISSFLFLLRNEIMLDQMYLQNRTISNTREFEASEIIVAGNNVTPALWDKTIAMEDFEIVDGADVSFRSGESILLMPGFRVENGSEFTAQIDEGLLVEYKGNLISLPIISGNKYANIQKTYFVKNSIRTDIITWRLTGENTDIYSNGICLEIPAKLNCGQYTLYCTITNTNGSETYSKVIEVSSDNQTEALKQILNPVIPESDTHNSKTKEKSPIEIKIYPNPNSGIFNIEWYGKIVSEYSIMVVNIIGKPVYYKEHVLPSLNKVDMSGLSKGIYFLKIQVNDKIYTEKVIYQ